MKLFWGVVAALVSAVQAWWRQVVGAQGRKKWAWGLIPPLVLVCGCCTVLQAALPSRPATVGTAATARPAVASDAEVIGTAAVATPLIVQATQAPSPTLQPEPTATPESDPAALLPPAPTEEVEPTAVTVATDVPTSVPTVAPLPTPTAGPPTGVARRAGNVRDQPTANGSTVIGSIAEGDVVTLRRRTSDGWYAVQTPGELIGWVSDTLLTVDDAVAAALPVGTTDPDIVVQPTARPAAVQPTAPSPAQGGNCDPSYPDVCIPSPPPDLNCGDISFRRFRVLQPDPHNFDGGRKNGIGCESD